MKKKNLKKHLRWLVPVLIFFCALVAVIATFKKDIHQKAVEARETELILAITDEMQNVDLSIARALSFVEASAKAMSFYGMEYNINQIKVIMKNIVDSTDVTDVYICNLEGAGYDVHGKDIFLGDESFFDEVVSEYSRGGTGMVRSSMDVNKDDKEVILVSRVTFEKKEKGFILAKLPVETLYEKMFAERYLLDQLAIVTLDGQILSLMKRDDTDETASSFWEMLPYGLSRDTIKLSLSQKSVYRQEVEDYGYAVVIPFKNTGGGVVALMNYDQMREMTSDENRLFMRLAGRVAGASVILLILILLANYVSDAMEDMLRKKKLSELDMDPATGLFTKTSAKQQIKAQLENPENNGGLLFLIGIEGVKKDSELDLKMADSRRLSFAKALSSNFRASDIVARAGDDRYLVFLKNIRADKDVRKQTDEMQMFLHDAEIDDGKMQISVHAGAALYPNNGNTVDELLKSAEDAYERSKEAGSGRLSF